LKPWGSSFGVWSRAPWVDRDGVRGLPERAGLGDSGAAASMELWSRRLWGQDLRLGGFVDAGNVRSHDASGAATNPNANASSIGLLTHFQWRGQVALSASLAHVLRGAGVVTRDANRFDLTLVARY
jgi:hemolysin activation/secretion protein